jgi:hypothetical protein
MTSAFRTRRTVLVPLLLIATGTPCVALADDMNERQLEIQIQELQRQLQAQSRRIDQLERGARSERGLTVYTEREAQPAPQSPSWLVAANWERINTGMSRSEVIEILGEPSAERAGEAGATLLLYARELEEGVFLAGSVELREGRVVAVNEPTLR